MERCLRKGARKRQRCRTIDKETAETQQICRTMNMAEAEIQDGGDGSG